MVSLGKHHEISHEDNYDMTDDETYCKAPNEMTRKWMVSGGASQVQLKLDAYHGTILMLATSP
jgi:hypothetical protein